MKTLHFIGGLPRAGSTMICNILKQNPQVHGEAISSLAGLIFNNHANWQSIDANKIYHNDAAKAGVLAGVLQGYYQHIEKSYIFDKSLRWVSLIPLIESVMQKKVKILCMVRNPAEVLASFEKLRKKNTMFFGSVDQNLGENSSIAARAYHYAGPAGILGLAHAQVKDAVIMGYLDRLLFVDYSRYCNSPKSQTKRIYDFFELPAFEHDFQNIEQTEVYNDTMSPFPGMYKIKNKLEKTTINCVEYLGLDLYQQYNREIFWDAWI